MGEPIALRRRIVHDFLERGLTWVGMARKYGMPAYGLGMSGSIEGVLRRALVEPKRRKRR